MVGYFISELRGVTQHKYGEKSQKQGQSYYSIHFEDESGKQFNALTEDYTIFDGLHRGDAVLAKLNIFIGTDFTRITALGLWKVDSLNETIIDLSVFPSTSPQNVII